MKNCYEYLWIRMTDHKDDPFEQFRQDLWDCWYKETGRWDLGPQRTIVMNQEYEAQKEQVSHGIEKSILQSKVVMDAIRKQIIAMKKEYKK